MHSFYREFEEKHRGSRELIRSRFEVYLPFVVPCKDLIKKPKIIDLGCGRGEWIEIMTQMGMDAKGIDLDEGMLESCQELGLNVVKADIFDYLKQIESESISVVSAFHVVEHIPFDLLCCVVNEIFRILVPGGLLLFETPNSENIMVGTSSFYMDPTHQKPIPSALLNFVVEYAGFDRVKILFLQESPAVLEEKKISLFSVLSDSSADYGIVAQKKASSQVMIRFDAAFSREYGIRIESLAERYDMQIREKFSSLEDRLKDSEIKANELKNEIVQIKNESIFFERMMHHWWHIADKLSRENKPVDLDKTKDIHSQKDKKKPVISFLMIFTLIKSSALFFRRNIRSVVLIIIRYINTVPFIKKNIMIIITKFPRLRNYFRRLIYSHEKSSSIPQYIVNHEGLSEYEARIYKLIKKESEMASGGIHENHY